MIAAPDKLLAELQEAARRPVGDCKLEDESGNAKRVERLLRATAADIVSVKTPPYVVEPAIELVIRAHEPQAPLLSVLVYLRDDRCDGFHLADVWHEKR